MKDLLGRMGKSYHIGDTLAEGVRDMFHTDNTINVVWRRVQRNVTWSFALGSPPRMAFGISTALREAEL